MASHWSIASTPPLASRRGRLVPSTRRTTSPASSSTFKCWEIAGCVISKVAASSITVASPLARRARIARRVGSAKAEKAASRFDTECITESLYKEMIICKEKVSPCEFGLQRIPNEVGALGELEVIDDEAAGLDAGQPPHCQRGLTQVVRRSSLRVRECNVADGTPFSNSPYDPNNHTDNYYGSNQPVSKHRSLLRLPESQSQNANVPTCAIRPAMYVPFCTESQ